MRGAFCALIGSFIMATFVMPPYLQYRKYEVDTTKQKIRTFIESINADFLPMIDKGEPNIPIKLSETKRQELEELAKRIDFNEFLSYREGNEAVVSVQEKRFLMRYYFYPKDALRR